MKPITPFGKKWEFRHSIWLIWLLFPFGIAAYFSFFYIAIRTGKKKWLNAGIIYLIIFIQLIHISAEFSEEHWMFSISVAAALIGWISASVHGFLARREYLSIISTRILEKEQMREIKEAEAQSNEHRPTEHDLDKEENTTVEKQDRPGRVVDY
ncbi:hypothetical protein SPD48_07870 [Pseudogracilibacillus sp. SE30717A]|uniref:hypothetical protein n=1 Tax=Pseudogracilibacillus sp. SE30717A TaxID=3098293 RepID=UPI00300E41E2